LQKLLDSQKNPLDLKKMTRFKISALNLINSFVWNHLLMSLVAWKP